MTLSPHSDNSVQASPGAWRLAWQRFRADRIGVWSACTVLCFLLLVALTATGLVAADWEKEVAIGHAPPSWATGASSEGGGPSQLLPDVLDYTPSHTDVLDPIAKEWAQAQMAVKPAGEKPDVLATHLPMGADKWGRDVLSKTIKGAETSVLVGLAAALVATVLGALLGR